jgi:hypothetical protein
MDLGKAGQIAAIMLTPALAFGAAVHLPGVVRVVRRLAERRAERRYPRPTGPPIEQLAADLRRLVGQHDAVRRATGVTMRAHHLRAIEGAITDCATQAARALGVAHPEPPVRGPLPTPELRRLLRALSDAGLALPAGAGLLN